MAPQGGYREGAGRKAGVEKETIALRLSLTASKALRETIPALESSDWIEALILKALKRKRAV